MASFTFVDPSTVGPKSRTGTGENAKAQAEMNEAVTQALELQQALVVQLSKNDKALTIRNRIKRAAQKAGVVFYVRTKGETVVAKYERDLTEDEIAAIPAPKKRGRKSAAETAAAAS